MPVLVVEDNLIQAEVLAELLTRRGRRAEIAVSAESAWPRLELHDYRAVIVDHCLPGADGLGVLRRMRGEPRWESVPVLLVTGLPDEELTALAAAAAEIGGPVQLLQKPFSIEEASAALDALGVP